MIENRLTTQNRALHPAAHLSAQVDTLPVAIEKRVGRDDVAILRVNDGEIGIFSERQPAFARNAKALRHIFIAERAKTARHFVKSLGLTKPLQGMIFTEIGEHHDPKEAEQTFREAVAAGKDLGLLSEAGCPGAQAILGEKSYAIHQQYWTPQ